LKDEGFLPQAILNYLALLGTSFKDEVQSLGELTQNYDFENLSSTGAIKFDIEKLRWLNHKWIERLSAKKLSGYIKPFLHDQIPASLSVSDDKLEFILDKIKTDLKILKDVDSVLKFYFDPPNIDIKEIENQFGQDKFKIALELIKENINNCDKTELFIDTIKAEAKNRGLKIREIFGTIRYLLTGKFSGIGLHDLFEILEDKEIRDRLSL
jgi:glutamyl/glutaminyl-tRNA synthetase